MPELGDALGTAALEVLRERGIEVSLGVSVAEVGAESVKFTDGRVLPCRTLIWTAGVAASPLIATLDAETVRGRIAVTAEMRVAPFEGVFALGDAAAVPDLAKGDGAMCPPTAQHSARQGRAVANNVIAALRNQPLEPYYHKDLGLVVDLGGKDAVSKPLGVELRGVPAQLVARGYHLMAMRTNAAKFRVGANGLLNATAGDDFVRTGFLARQPARLRDFEYTDAYLTRDQVKEHTQALLAKG